MMEIGPYRVKDEKTLVPNNGSWNEFANLLFVDNPVGTGFSYVDTDSFVHELDDMADQFVQFLEKWFELFPQYDTDDVGTRCSPQLSSLLTWLRSTSLVSLMLGNISPTLRKRLLRATRRTLEPHGT